MVNNETDLRNAINDAPSGKSITIALGNDIALAEGSFDISAGKDVTLTSSKVSGYCKLIGVNGFETIVVRDGGVLTLDGIIVTHKKDENGSGVFVDSGGMLILRSGEISGNIATMRSSWATGLYEAQYSNGGGVYNSGGGVFKMYGGKISNNTAWHGGGVSTGGVFELYGGEIIDNTAYYMHGGGVGASGVFEMSGGKISGNKASVDGGGVNNNGYSTFALSGGEISGNTAGRSGGGVYNVIGSNCVFVMSGGIISGNTAIDRGGGVGNYCNFTMLNGRITGNTAGLGGGVFNFGSGSTTVTFDWQGGVISGNTAINGYNDVVYPDGSGESSAGDNGTSNGNNGSSGGHDGTNNNDNESSIGGFSLREAVLIGVSFVSIVIGVIGIVLFFASRKQLVSIEKTVHNGEPKNEQ